MKPVKINPLAKMILSWKSRRLFKAEAFSFAQKLKESQKVLICMPASLERFALAKESLSNFAEIFEGKTIFVFLPFLRADGLLSIPPGYDVIYPRKEDLKIFSIPRTKFIQRLKEHQLDISLNLDLEDGFFNGYLCLMCGASLRIGVQRKNAFPFYNVQLAVFQERTWTPEVYKEMANMLKSFAADSIKTNNV